MFRECIFFDNMLIWKIDRWKKSNIEPKDRENEKRWRASQSNAVNTGEYENTCTRVPNSQSQGDNGGLEREF